MKICPNCGSVLADFEPYCTNCGFDPDFDSERWKPGGYSSKINYYHGQRIKSSSNSKNEDLDAIAGFIFLAVLVGCAFLYLEMYDWNIGLLIWSNLQSIFLLIIFVIAFAVACNYFNKL